MIHDKVIAIANDMRQEIEAMEDDSEKSIMESSADFHTARTLRKFVVQLELVIQQDAAELVAANE